MTKKQAAAEKTYPTGEAAPVERPEMPERFSNGGATADEREAWIKENWPEEAEAKCGPPDEA